MRTRTALWVALGVWLGTSAYGQIPEFDDNFSKDPSGNGWLLQGVATWVPPESPECVDPITGAPDPNNFDTTNPCSVYGESVIETLPGFEDDPIEEFGGYILVTSAVGNQSGNAFRTEKTEYDNFRMEVVVELRDGSVGRPADGMTIVIIGTDTPPGIGAGGGAMGSTGLGTAPTMIFEFDNWSCNNQDFNDQNHVGFAYEANGFPGVDWIPMDVFVRLDESVTPLHNRQDAIATGEQADPNRYRMTVFVQNGTVACDLEAIDLGIDLGRVYTHTIPDFKGFEGFLGVTASTGGAWQNHILHSAQITQLPPGFCLEPPGSAERRISSNRNDAENCGDWEDGDVLTVDIEITRLREANENCDAPAQIVLKETLPANWAASGISDGGSFDAGSGVITWTLTGAALAAGKTVSYSVTAVDNGNTFESFLGKIQEADNPDAAAQGARIDGESRVRQDTPFDPICGGITCWNVLGPYEQPPGQVGDNPGDDNIRMDYLTDGETFETDFVFFPGAQIGTDFGGAAWSTGLTFETRGRNVDGVPTVVAWNDPDDFINLNDDVYAGDPNQCMAYAQCYINNTTGDDLEIGFAVSSDDSVQVILNGEEVWIHSIPRGGSNGCAPQDFSPDGITFIDPHLLEAGENSLIVKTFEGGGGFNFSITIQDTLGLPIQEGLEISKFPVGECPRPPFVAARIVDTGATAEVQGEELPAWEFGQTYSVQLEVTDIRPAGITDACPDAPTAATLRERVPDGWAISNVSAGGTANGQVISWDLAGAPIGEQTLSYDVTAPKTADDVNFIGSFREPGSLLEFAVGGASRLVNPTDFSSQGFWSKWMLLGPYQMPVGFGWGAAPTPDNMRLDFLTDGDENEIDIEPRPGDTINTDFRGAAASLGLANALGSARDRVNPGGVPTWARWIDANDTLNYDDYYGGNIDNNVMYAVIYVLVEEDISVDIGLDSDDSIQVLLDGQEIWLNSIPRGVGGPNTVVDVVAALDTPALNPLEAGLHKVMVKVFEGGGAHQFRFRFQDPVTGEPVTEGISLCFSPDPAECGGKVVVGPVFVRGDVDASGVINITDAVFLLNFLFGGGPTPPCVDAADVDNLGANIPNITDAVFLLNWLFQGGPEPPAPAPGTAAYTRDACDEDPEGDADGITCDGFAPCA